MDKAKVDALFQWVQLLLDDNIENNFATLFDIKVHLEVLKLVDKDVCIEEHQDNTSGMLECILSYLEGIYGGLRNAINKTGILAKDQFEIIKLLVVILVAAVNSDNVSYFVEPIMTLSRGVQTNLMSILSSMNERPPEEDLATVLKEVLCNTVTDEESQLVMSPASFIFSPIASTMSNGQSFINSPSINNFQSTHSSSFGIDSPFNVMASPRVISKQELFEKNKMNVRIRRLESNVEAQSHIIDELEQKLRESRKKSQMLETINGKVRNRVKSLSAVQDEVDSLKMVKVELEAKELQLQRTNDRYEGILKENYGLKAEMDLMLKRLEAEKGETDTKLGNITEKCRNLQSSEDSLKVKNIELVNSIKILKDEYHRIVEEKEKECKELLEHVKFLKEQLSIGENTEKSEDSFVVVDEKQQCLKNELNIVQLEEDIKKTNEELKSFKEKYENSTKLVFELKNQLNESRSAIVSHEKDLEAKSAALEEFKIAFENEVRCGKEREAKVMLQLGQLQLAKKELEVKLNSMQNENCTLRREKEEALISCSKEKDCLERLLHEQEIRARSVELDIANLQQEKDALEKSLKDKCLEIAKQLERAKESHEVECYKLKENHQKKVCELEQIISDRMAEVAKSKESYDGLVKTKRVDDDIFVQRISALVEERNQAVSSVTVEMTGKLNDVIKERDLLKFDFDCLSNEKEEVVNKNCKLVESINSCRNALKDISQEKFRVDNELESTKATLTEKQNEIDDLNAKVCEVNAMFKKELEEKCKELSEVAEVRKSLELSVDELKTEVNDIKENSKSKLDEYIAGMEATESKWKDVENENCELRCKIDEASKEIEDRQEQLVGLESAMKDVKFDCEERVLKLSNEMTELEQDLKMQIELAEDQVGKLKEERNEAVYFMKVEMTERLNDVIKEKDILKSELELIRNEKEKAVNTSQKLFKDISASQCRLEEILEEKFRIEIELESAASILGKRQDEIKDMTAKIGEMDTKFNEEIKEKCRELSEVVEVRKSLESSIEKLKKEVDDAKENSKRKEKEYISLIEAEEAKCKDFENEKNLLKSELESIKCKKEDAVNENCRLVESINSCQNALKDMSQEKFRVDNELESTKATLTEKQNQIDDLNAQVCEMNTSFDKELEEKCKELSEVAEVRKSLELTVDELKKEVNDIKEDSKNKMEEYISLIEAEEAKCKDVENEKNLHKSELESIKSEKEDAVNENYKLVESITLCQSKLEDLLQEKSHIESELESAESRLGKRQIEIDDLNAKVCEMTTIFNKELEEKCKELSEVAEVRKSLELSVDELKKEVNNIKENSKNKMEEYISLIEAEQAKCKDVENERNLHKSELDSIKSEKEDAANENYKLVESINSCRNALKDISQEKFRVDNELESTTATLAEKQNEIDDLNAKVCEVNAMFKKELEEKCKELSEVAEVRKSLELSVDELKKEVNDIKENSKSKLEEYIAGMEAAESKWKDVENENCELRCKIDEASKEIEDRQEQLVGLESAMKDVKFDCEERVLKLSNEMTELEQDLKMQIELAEDQVGKLKEERNEAVYFMKVEMTERLNDVIKEKDILKSELELIKSEKEKAVNSSQKLVEDISVSQSRLEEILEEKSRIEIALESAASILGKRQDEIKDMTAKIGEMDTKFNEEIKEKCRELSEVVEVRKSLESSIEKLKKEVDDAKENSKRKEKEYISLIEAEEAKCKDFENEKNLLKSELESIKCKKEDAVNENCRLVESINSCQNALKDMSQEKFRVDNELESTKTTLTEKQNQIDTLTAKVFEVRTMFKKELEEKCKELSEVAEVRKSLELSVDELKTEVNDIKENSKSKLEEYIAGMKAAESKWKDVENENCELRCKIDEASKEIEDRQEQLVGLESAMKDVKFDCEERVLKLSNEMTELEQDLKMQIELAEDQVGKLKEERNEAVDSMKVEMTERLNDVIKEKDILKSELELIRNEKEKAVNTSQKLFKDISASQSRLEDVSRKLKLVTSEKEKYILSTVNLEKELKMSKGQLDVCKEKIEQLTLEKVANEDKVRCAKEDEAKMGVSREDMKHQTEGIHKTLMNAQHGNDQSGAIVNRHQLLHVRNPFKQESAFDCFQSSVGDGSDLSFDEQSTLVCDDLTAKRSPSVRSLNINEEDAFGGSITSLQSIASTDSNISRARSLRRQSGIISGPARRRSLLYMAGKTPPERRTTLSVAMPCIPACQMEDEPDILESKGFDDDLHRISELKRRNTLCLPHLKSSYPLEVIAAESVKNVQDSEYEASVRNGLDRSKKRKSEDGKNELPPKRKPANPSNLGWSRETATRAVKSDSNIITRSMINEGSQMIWGNSVKNDDMQFEAPIDPRRESIAFSVDFDEPKKKLKSRGSLRRSRGSAHLFNVGSKEGISASKESLSSQMLVKPKGLTTKQVNIEGKENKAIIRKIYRSETPKQTDNRTSLKSRTNTIRKSIRKSISKVRGGK